MALSAQPSQAASGPRDERSAVSGPRDERPAVSGPRDERPAVAEPRDAVQPAAEPRDARQARLAALLDDARRGDRAALNAIVADLTPLLWHIARLAGLDPAACEDVIQTTWLHLLRELHTIREPQALTAWLATVARREAVHAATAAQRERPGLDTLPDRPDAAAVDAEDAVVRDERSRALWRAMESLPARCRELLRLVAFVHRPDYDAVATALGMPRGSIGPTRGRCLAKLREHLSAERGWSWP